MFNKKLKTKEDLKKEYKDWIDMLLLEERTKLDSRERDVKFREDTVLRKERDFEEHKNTVLLEQINKHGWKVEIVGNKRDYGYSY